jgi:hypothetical protein
MEKISAGEEVGGAGGAYSYNALKRLDQIWSSICEAQTGMGPMVKHYINSSLLSGFSASDLVATKLGREACFDHTKVSYLDTYILK